MVTWPDATKIKHHGHPWTARKWMNICFINSLENKRILQFFFSFCLPLFFFFDDFHLFVFLYSFPFLIVFFVFPLFCLLLLHDPRYYHCSLSLSLCLSVSFTFDSIWFVGRFGRVVPLAIGYQIGNFFPSPLELKSGRCCFNWMMIVYMSQIHFSFSPSLSLSPSLSPYLFSSSSGLSLFGVNVFVVTAASDLFAVALFEYGKCFTALVECISARPFPREPCWGKYKRGLKEEKNLYLRAPTQTHRVRYRVI